MERTWWIRDGNGSRINKTLRFCRRCIDVVFILSSLMSTCELDRFVIQTPYIKVLKSCSAPFVDGAGIDNSDIGRTDGRTDGRTNRRNERTRAQMDKREGPVSSLRSGFLSRLSDSQYVEEGSYPYADSSPLT